MSVYVDDMRAPYGRMRMCHMVADTREELDQMADTIRVDRRWVQVSRGGVVHYDICLSKRVRAVAAGACEIDRRGLAAFMRTEKEMRSK